MRSRERASADAPLLRSTADAGADAVRGAKTWWQSHEAATAPGGAILVAWDSRTGLRYMQVTSREGVEFHWSATQTWRPVDHKELLEKGYREIAEPPGHGSTVEDAEGTRWRVGTLLEDGRRELWTEDREKRLLTTLSAIVETMKVVETMTQRLEREGREHAQRIEAELEAKRQAAEGHVSAAQYRREQGKTDQLFA